MRTFEVSFSLFAAAAVAGGLGCAGDHVGTTSTGTGGAGTGGATAATTSASTSASSSSTGGPSCMVAPATDDLTIATQVGTVHGKLDGTVKEFLGVPFAAPPTGDLRWRPPQPHACWTDVRDATKYGDACMQILPNMSNIGSEDCLYLNVFVPSGGAKQKPVLFFIFGGAYVLGSGNQDLIFKGTGNLYDGKTLAEERDVIVVTINYRLGLLGFMAHPALAAEDPNASSGNYGTLDQIAGLQWVHDNIAAFGGDASRVMVFGESAGGLSTCLLLTTPLAKGLFSSALIESGGCIVAPKDERETEGKTIAMNESCATAPDVVKCLRQKPATDFLTNTGADFFNLILKKTDRAWEMPEGPNLDGWVFPEKPMEALKNGYGNKVPLAIGSNANEFDLFIPPGLANTCVAYWGIVNQLFPAHATQIDALYDCVVDYSGYGRFAGSAVGTDFMFTCPARRIARAALMGGFPSVHRYHDRRGYSNSPLSVERVFHASELPFVFRTFGVFGYSPNAGDMNVSKAYAGYWTRLAASGDPNGGADPAWPAYDALLDPALVIDDPISTTNGIAAARCDYWDTFAAE